MGDGLDGLGDGPEEFFRGHWLHDVGVEARRRRALSIRLLAVPGQRNKVDPSAQSEPKSARHFVSVHIRQTHINEDVECASPD
jgi:hypothetical protein